MFKRAVSMDLLDSEETGTDFGLQDAKKNMESATMWAGTLLFIKLSVGNFLVDQLQGVVKSFSTFPLLYSIINIA